MFLERHSHFRVITQTFQKSTMTRLTCGRKGDCGERGCEEGRRGQGGRAKALSRSDRKPPGGNGVSLRASERSPSRRRGAGEYAASCPGNSFTRPHFPRATKDPRFKGALLQPAIRPSACSQHMPSHSAYLRVGNFLRKWRRSGEARLTSPREHRSSLHSPCKDWPLREPLVSGTTLSEKNLMSDCRKQLSQRERLSLALSPGAMFT